MRRCSHIRRYAAIVLMAGLPLFFAPSGTVAATDGTGHMYLAPSSQHVTVGSTFTLTIGINTGGQAINAFKSRILFPADKLQVVTPNLGNSITGFWVSRPVFSNTEGYLELEGAIPSPGINTDAGVIATITMRARGIGSAVVKFDSTNSLAYLNDGKATELPLSFVNANYDIALPPPSGPAVTSLTHPDQEEWYSQNDVVFEWGNQDLIQGYSYVLNAEPLSVPDDISEGNGVKTTYSGLPDGIHYFHVKALRDGVWGPATHFGLKIQTAGPAKFTIDVLPGTKSSATSVIFAFNTTDNLSGVDHYEIRLVPLTPPDVPVESFFVETVSPYVLTRGEEHVGPHDAIVRAYNKAGNFTESTVRVHFVTRAIEFVDKGDLLVAYGKVFIPWYLVWVIVLTLTTSLFYPAYHMRVWYRSFSELQRRVPEHHREVSGKLETFRERLKSLKIIVLLVLTGFMLFGPGASAQGVTGRQFAAPVIDTVSGNINNNEIFYVGGRAAIGPENAVIIYLQSLQSGETYSFATTISTEGEWFYTHPTFLGDGEYVLWTQLRVGNELSPPSAQKRIAVSATALQFGASRLSYEFIYLALLAVSFCIIAGLGGFIIYHFHHGRRKRDAFMSLVRHTEDELKQGFSALRHDINQELAVIKNAKLGADLPEKDKAREEHLLHDLREIEDHIGKEIWRIGKKFTV